MNNKIIGAILLSAAGLVAAIGTVGAQIANAIVLGGFYAGPMTGEVPPGPLQASPPWIVGAAILVLAGLGLYFLFRSDKPE
jgi:hypothetical protein